MGGVLRTGPGEYLTTLIARRAGEKILSDTG